MVDVSIIIVSWNTKELLLKCLNSLTCRVPRFPTEIIVVDNASRDGSPEAVQRYFPDIQLIRNDENLGFAKANNIGIKQSTGRYVCLVNSDVMVHEDCIDRMCEYMDHHPSTGMIGPKMLNPDLTLQASARRFPSLWNSFCEAFFLHRIFPRSGLFNNDDMAYWPYDSVCRVDVLVGCFWMVRKEAIDQVGLLDEDFFMYAEDLDWCRRFIRGSWDVIYFPHSQAIHYGGGSSESSPTRFFVERQRANLKYWKKQHSLPTRVVFILIILAHQLVRIILGTIYLVIRLPKRRKILPKIQRNLACTRWLLGFGTGTK
jgi:GT2 family glycosyltransferase